MQKGEGMSRNHTDTVQEANQEGQADRARYKNDRKGAKMQQGDRLKAQQIQKLREMRVKAINNGAMETSLPNVHDHMSDQDIAAASRKLERYDRPAAKADTKPATTTPAPQQTQAAKTTTPAKPASTPAPKAASNPPAKAAPASTPAPAAKKEEAPVMDTMKPKEPGTAWKPEDQKSDTRTFNPPAKGPAKPAAKPADTDPRFAKERDEMARDSAERNGTAPPPVVTPGAGAKAALPVTAAPVDPGSRPAPAAGRNGSSDSLLQTQAAPPAVAPAAPAAPAGVTPGAAVPGQSTGNPMEDLAAEMKNELVGQGKMAPGQRLMKTGAGYVTPALDANGQPMSNPDGTPRTMAVRPNFEENLNVKTGGAYRGWTPEQRAQYFRLNPASSQGTEYEGTVTDAGAGAFDHRGEQVQGQKALPGTPGAVRTPGGDYRTMESVVYDPRMDSMKPGDIAKKYGDKTGGSIKGGVAPAAMAKAPAAGRSGSSNSLMNAMPAAPTAGGAPAADAALTAMAPSTPGTNLSGPASSSGTANQLAPNPNVNAKPATNNTATNTLFPNPDEDLA